MWHFGGERATSSTERSSETHFNFLFLDYSVSFSFPFLSFSLLPSFHLLLYARYPERLAGELRAGGVVGKTRNTWDQPPQEPAFNLPENILAALAD